MAHIAASGHPWQKEQAQYMTHIVYATWTGTWWQHILVCSLAASSLTLEKSRYFTYNWPFGGLVKIIGGTTFKVAKMYESSSNDSQHIMCGPFIAVLVSPWLVIVSSFLSAFLSGRGEEWSPGDEPAEPRQPDPAVRRLWVALWHHPGHGIVS